MAEKDLFEGEFKLGRVINASITKQGARFDLVVEDEGPHKGKRAAYSGKFDDKYIATTKRDMKRAGWKGQTSRTFVDDLKATSALLPFTAEIASFTRDDGKVSEWTAARLGPPELSDDDARSVDGWLAATKDTPANSAHPNAPGSDDERLPF